MPLPILRIKNLTIFILSENTLALYTALSRQTDRHGDCSQTLTGESDAPPPAPCTMASLQRASVHHCATWQLAATTSSTMTSVASVSSARRPVHMTARVSAASPTSASTESLLVSVYECACVYMCVRESVCVCVCAWVRTWVSVCVCVLVFWSLFGSRCCFSFACMCGDE